MKKNKNLKKGFTLIELMVVITIITLISSVVIASTTIVREKAKITRAQAEMKQIVNAIIIAQGEKGKPLVSFAPSSNCGHCSCQLGGNTLNSPGCASQWEATLSQIESATNGLVTGLSNFKKDPWGNPYMIDANQGQSGLNSCTTTDAFSVYGQTIPNKPTIPLSPVCP